MTNNFQSIVGGIIRGLTNDKASAGTNPHIPTQQNNPLVYTWIAQQTNDLRQPIEKEQSQNPSLPFGKASSGTQYEYTNPLPTDIRMLISQGSPGTNIDPTQQASSIGSLIQTVPDLVPLNNWNFSGFGMSPQNADHFKSYFANQLGVQNTNKYPLSGQILAEVQEQANTNADGSSNVWHGAWQTFETMTKPYHPANQFRHGLRYS